MAREYRVTNFLTLTGIRVIVELGDFIYGEWILSERGVSKYHVNCYSGFESDKLISDFIDAKKGNLQSILDAIKVNRGVKLEEVDYPCIRIEVKSEIKTLDLKPLPLEWMQEIVES